MGRDPPAHLLRKLSGDGQAEPGGFCSRLHGVEAVKKAHHLKLAKASGTVGKSDFPVCGERDGKVSLAVFYGVVNYVIENP